MIVFVLVFNIWYDREKYYFLCEVCKIDTNYEIPCFTL